jgi:hypothetical protein
MHIWDKDKNKTEDGDGAEKSLLPELNEGMAEQFKLDGEDDICKFFHLYLFMPIEFVQCFHSPILKKSLIREMKKKLC